MMLCCATAILAQNNRISYQAVVRDTANRLVANKTVTVTVEIFNGDAQTAAYTETHTNVQTNYNGLFSLQIGGGTATGVSWDEAEINWKDAKVITAVSLGGTELATLEMPLTAVPYALYADEINPAGTVVTNIYDKMQRDSLALGTLIDANAAEIGNLKIADANLSQRIVADSNNLVALQNRVNTFNTHICDTVMNCDGIKTMRDSIQINAGAIKDLQAADQNFNTRLNRISDSVKTNRQAIIDSTESVLGALTDTARALRGLIKATDDKFGDYYTKNETNYLLGAKADTGSVYTRTVVDNKLDTKANASEVYTMEQTYSQTEVNSLLAAMKARIDSLANVTKNLPKMAQDSFTVATNDQVNFELKNVPDADHVLRMYINGVMVGGSHSGVLTIDPDNNKVVVYHSEKNKNRDGVAYALKAGDKVTVVYWYVATASTSGN